VSRLPRIQELVMTLATYDIPGQTATHLHAEYQPGVCNIGPAEIARRRRAGHTGLIAAVGLFAALVLIGAPDWTRLLVGIPAIISASGYIQAHLRFCAGFGSAGVFNFGELGPTERVQSAADRARDRARATQIGVASFAIGLAVALIAYALPV
jgi:hypothetical protein